MSFPKASMKKSLYVVILLVLIGLFLRLPPFLFTRDSGALQSIAALHPQPGFQNIGFDEGLYRGYVSSLDAAGLASYPDLAERYVVDQTRLPAAILPPTRFLYIFLGYLWHSFTGQEALQSLKVISSIFSMLLLIVSTVFAIRAGGIRIGATVCALMAFAPTQLHMSQHALIDGVFAFWAVTCLWLLWENLQRPNDWRLLLPLGASLALLVLTKENAFFAYIALCAVLAVCFWQKYGRITQILLGTMIIGPLVGRPHPGQSLRIARNHYSHLPIAREQGFRSSLRHRHRGRALVSLSHRPDDRQSDCPDSRARLSLPDSPG